MIRSRSWGESRTSHEGPVPSPGPCDGTATLSDGVRLTTADGWVVTAPEFRALTGEGVVSADRQVDVRAPFGDLTAGAMELRPQSPGKADHVLDLKGGVRLIYRP